MSDDSKIKSSSALEAQRVIDFDELGEDAESNAPEKQISGAQLESYIDDIADTVRVGLDQSISILTPWFFNNMPKIYYQSTPRQEKVRHLSAIITGHVFETKQTVELWDRDRSKVTYIGPGGDKKILNDMAHQLVSHKAKMGAVYFSRDKLLFLSTFFCSQHKEADQANPRIAEKLRQTRSQLLEEFPTAETEIDRYLNGLDNDFIIYATVNRLGLTFRMAHYMQFHQGAHTVIDPFENSPRARLTLGMKNIEPTEMLEHIFALIQRYDFNVVRAFVVKLEKGYDETVTVMHFIIDDNKGKKIDHEHVPAIRLSKALRTLGWVDNDEYSVFATETYDLSINAIQLLRSMSSWVHIFMSKHNPYAYSNYRIFATLQKYPNLTKKVVELFRTKFDPNGEEARAKGAYEAAQKEIEKDIENVIEEIDKNIFRECARFVQHCLVTNYFLSTKTGLAFRLAPEVLDRTFYPNMPFGIFFITGRDFRCFQVRWKDIARGGLRVVMPRSSADYDYALAGIFDEVYGLSHAQQLKNKDIPEGGSKAVLVLKQGGHRDQAVRGAVNALLDLLVFEDESHETTPDKIVRYYDKPEIIYLGPDENITNDLITWIPQQAKRRGYRYAAAFMSSKPGEGINHKEYGVTSEGVNVFLENTLKYMGVNPRQQKFSVKMTGGPDGDVAGNELKILHREYGENARVVAIGDGFGCAYDPEGLNWQELLRLVRDGESIVKFDKSKLSKNNQAFVVPADTIENIKTRNELSGKVYADVFIPAGGRPYTVNGKNWELYLDNQKRPTMRAIVEGANIFFTSEARDRLQERGVVIIKDSSANKCGVICSSYEIIASLTVETDEFMAMKSVYVAQVLDILRTKADYEAKLLFKSLTQSDGSKTLVELSLEISKEINLVTDILLDELHLREKEVNSDPFYASLIERHCPPILVEKYRDRIHTRLPLAHKIAIIASSVASYVVYREGLGWLKSIPKELWLYALETYMRKDLLTGELITAVSGIDPKLRDQIEAILRRSAASDLTIHELQQQRKLS